MKNIMTVFSREIKAYFNSAIAYIFIIVFLLISVGLYMTQFFLISMADMRGFFFILPLILCVFLPAVSMRLWAEDRKGNTLELLLTFPIKTYELVLGKYLAGLVFYLSALFSTAVVPVMIIVLGAPDVGAIVCQYLGAFLLGSFFIALGIFVSGFCRDQIVSFIVAMMACFGFYLIGNDFVASSIDGWVNGLGAILKSALGVTQHFLSFQKGVIDNRDIIYFLASTSVFLVLNGLWLDSRMKPRSRTVFGTTCLISVGSIMLLNVIFSDMPIGRFDLTEGKVYTISGATAGILRDLKAPVTAKLFISPPDKMPGGLKTLERDIRDKLDEFKVSAKGKFDYKVFHLEAANVTVEGGAGSAEKSAGMKGVVPFQVRSIEADELGVKLIYSSISMAYKEKAEEIIPRIMPENINELEYTLASTIFKMTMDKAAKVALLAPYTERAVDPQMMELLKNLGGGANLSEYRDDDYEMLTKLLAYEGYDVSRIRLTEEEPLPEDAGTLIVLDEENLNDRQLFEINRFLVNGGSVFLGIQSYEFRYSSAGMNGLTVNAVDKQPGINPLLEKWGLGVNQDFLMDTQADVISMAGDSKLFGIFQVSTPVKLPMQIKIISDQMNRNVSITSRLASIFYLWGSALTLDTAKIEAASLNKEILFSSSDNSWEAKFHQGNITNQDLEIAPREQRKSFPLAVFLSGEFPDAYAGKPVPEWPKKEEAGGESYERPVQKSEISPKPGKLILVGCAKMFDNNLIGEKGHMTFFVNSIDAITLGEQLIKIRSKQPIDRSLERLSSSARAWWRVFTTFLIPVFLGITGSVHILLRKRSKWVYLKKS